MCPNGATWPRIAPASAADASSCIRVNAMAAIAALIASAIPITICCGAAIRSPLLRIAWCHLVPFSHTRPVLPYPCTSLPPRQTAGSSSQILHISIPSPPPTSGERQQGHAMNTMVPYLTYHTPLHEPFRTSYSTCLKPRPGRPSHQTTSKTRVPVACSYILYTTLHLRPPTCPPCALTQTAWKPWLSCNHRLALRPCAHSATCTSGQSRLFHPRIPDCDCAFELGIFFSNYRHIPLPLSC
jgi:hypothetical protein